MSNYVLSYVAESHNRHLGLGAVAILVRVKLSQLQKRY